MGALNNALHLRLVSIKVISREGATRPNGPSRKGRNKSEAKKKLPLSYVYFDKNCFSKSYILEKLDFSITPYFHTHPYSEKKNQMTFYHITLNVSLITFKILSQIESKIRVPVYFLKKGRNFILYPIL